MGTLCVRTLPEICKFFRINTLEEREEDCSENGLSFELADFRQCSHILLFPLRNERMMGNSHLGTSECNAIFDYKIIYGRVK